jgi:hypothetical protein
MKAKKTGDVTNAERGKDTLHHPPWSFIHTDSAIHLDYRVNIEASLAFLRLADYPQHSTQVPRGISDSTETQSRSILNDLQICKYCNLISDSSLTNSA